MEDDERRKSGAAGREPATATCSRIAFHPNKREHGRPVEDVGGRASLRWQGLSAGNCCWVYIDQCGHFVVACPRRVRLEQGSLPPRPIHFVCRVRDRTWDEGRSRFVLSRVSMNVPCTVSCRARGVIRNVTKTNINWKKVAACRCGINRRERSSRSPRHFPRQSRDRRVAAPRDAGVGRRSPASAVARSVPCGSVAAFQEHGREWDGTVGAE